ncbi:nucleotide pyrophosphohydrolase [Haloarcula hispanica]|uniref:Nucleotide pyrophosphohydrolase n=1 Tax=Haloarcula hispanica TaxID=51589 RepID=A0A5J5LNV5_HALHI|nr:nucleotide pyrophosphohydrolase [Haloarcula hispanica]KAA9410964.1 nucleotide pyrophosphohydrolase [Haloarcula hispanica]
MDDSISELCQEYAEFVEKRDWDRFHTPQNLAMAISIESNELLEEFLWFNNPASEEVQKDDDLVDAVSDELADVVIYALGMANQLDIDLAQAVEEKMAENEERFDEETAEEISADLDEWQ